MLHVQWEESELPGQRMWWGRTRLCTQLQECWGSVAHVACRTATIQNLDSSTVGEPCCTLCNLPHGEVCLFYYFPFVAPDEVSCCAYRNLCISELVCKVQIYLPSALFPP